MKRRRLKRSIKEFLQGVLAIAIVPTAWLLAEMICKSLGCQYNTAGEKSSGIILYIPDLNFW